MLRAAWQRIHRLPILAAVLSATVLLLALAGGPREAQAAQSASLSNLSYSFSDTTLTVSGTVSYTVDTPDPGYKRVVRLRTYYVDNDGNRSDTGRTAVIASHSSSATYSGSFSISQWPNADWIPDKPALQLQVKVVIYHEINPSLQKPGRTESPYADVYSAVASCSDSDATNAGDFFGFQKDISGSLSHATSCAIGSRLVDLHAITISESRDMTFTFTPTVAAASAWVAVYRTSIANTALSTGSANSGAANINQLSIVAGTPHIVAVGSNSPGGYSLSIQYGYIQPPTPTPRAQLNLDFRLVPDPASLGYRVGQNYAFTLEGPAGTFPLSVRSGNPAAFAMGVGAAATCPSQGSPPSSASITAKTDTLYLTACAAGNNSTLSAIGPDGALLAQYSLYIGAGAVPTPVPSGGVVGPGGGAPPPPSDKLGLGIIIGAICSGVGVGCDVDLIVNLLATVVASAIAIWLLPRNRGAIGSLSMGVSITYGIIGLMLAYLWVGYPDWVLGVALAVVLAFGGIAFMQKGRQAG